MITLLLGMTASLTDCGATPDTPSKPAPRHLAANAPARKLIAAARTQIGVTRQPITGRFRWKV